MKVCPTCQSRYTDDTLLYCLQDGSALVNDESLNPPPTVAYTGELETVVKNRQADTSQYSQESQTRVRQTGGAADYQPQPKSSNTTLILVIALLAMILVFGAVGIGAWLYFSKGKTEVAQNTNINSSTPENAKTNTNVNSSAFPSPNISKTPTPTPNVSPEEVKREVSDRINSWTSALASRNLSSYMSHYADTVDYFNRNGASVATVRADKQRAFAVYDSFEVEISNLRVTTDASGETATAVFDKQWYFEGDASSSEGKVQTQLRLRKIGGAWKITGEKDLKVYYTN